MKRKHFEASVCRESDQHDWRWFISWQEDDEWVSCIFDATAQGLDQAIHMTDIREMMLANIKNTREIIDAYFHACELNCTCHRLDAA